MELLSGNEAIARGAWEAGASIGVAYPGTPSTETMETFAKFEDVYAEWCTNEKVAVEVGLGASAAGARVLATMKHVGVNVAADPLFTAAYTGVGGGFVLLAADDPGMYSSQDEQDSRWYGQAAHIPVMDPSDAQEALDFTRDAYELSERFDVPFMIRSTVRISHTRCLVEMGERKAIERRAFQKNPAKWVMMPAFAKPRRKMQLERIAELEEWVETCSYNKAVYKDTEIGIICAGAAYQHVLDALPNASVLKIGISWPLPKQLLSDFASRVEKAYVVEEGSEYLSMQVAAAGVALDDFPFGLHRDGEISPAEIRAALGMPDSESYPVPEDVPGRPPSLCPGCPHRLVFRELGRIKAIVTGDIGCYTLGTLPPLSAMHTCLDMGASISMSHGFELAMAGEDHDPVVAVIGDSTFGHSGLSSLVSTVYNQGAGTVCILDNRTTAMTGRQGNPFNGVTLQGRESRELDLPALVQALGIDDVAVVDPHDAKAVRAALKHATKENAEGLSVIIFKAPCVLLHRTRKPAFFVNADCIGCGMCVTLGCPAISKDIESGIASIDGAMCIGCGQCAQYCPQKAIEQLPAGM